MSGGFEAAPGGWKDGAFHGMSLMIHGVKEVTIERDEIESRPHLDIVITDKNRHTAKITLFLMPEAKVDGVKE